MTDRFVTLVDEANALVQRADPDLKFYSAEGNPEGGSGTTAESLTTWKFIFRGVRNKKNTITYANGSFGPVEGSPQSWLGDQIIKLPITRGLADAVSRLHEAGYTMPFSAAVLRWPLYPGSKASYIFFLQGKHIFVGVESGHVSEHSRKVRAS